MTRSFRSSLRGTPCKLGNNSPLGLRSPKTSLEPTPHDIILQTAPNQIDQIDHDLNHQDPSLTPSIDGGVRDLHETHPTQETCPGGHGAYTAPTRQHGDLVRTDQG